MSDTTDPVELVAKAIYECEHDIDDGASLSWRILSAGHMIKLDYRERARTVIAALEPHIQQRERAALQQVADKAFRKAKETIDDHQYAYLYGAYWFVTDEIAELDAATTDTPDRSAGGE